MPKVEVNGIQIYYEFHGSENAPVLVLNNGIIMNATTSWAFQTPTLSRHYRLLQYDCRGQGQSDHPADPYTMELHADDLAELLNHLSIDKAHMLGISYGGELIQAFALKYPQLTASLILANTVSEIGPELRLIVECWRHAAKLENPDLFYETTVPWNFSARFIEQNPELLANSKPRYGLLDFPAVVRLCDCFFEFDLTSRLSEIKVPVCIIAADKDLTKGTKYALKIKERIAHAEMHVLLGDV